MWAVHILNISVGMSLNEFGIYPRAAKGLPGILLSPLLHGSWLHLISNSMSFIVLSTGLFYFYPKIGYKIFSISWLCVGILVWITGRPSFHIGASGVIYALASFLFLSGILRKHYQLMAVSLVVVFLYGSMIWGIFPNDPTISWESHFSGLVVGFFLAFIFRKQGPQKKVYSWEYEDDNEEIQNEGFYSNHTHELENIEIKYPNTKSTLPKNNDPSENSENTINKD